MDLSPPHQDVLSHLGLHLEILHVVPHQRTVPPHIKHTAVKLQLVPASLGLMEMERAGKQTAQQKERRRESVCVCVLPL